MAKIWSVCCFFAACTVGNMVGTLNEGSMKAMYTRMEKSSVSTKDLYYIQQLNPKHGGIDGSKSCPSIVQKGDRDLELIFYTLQTTIGLEKLRSQAVCKYEVTEKDEEIILKALESPANVKEYYMAIGCELIRGNIIAAEDAIPMYAELVKQDDSVLAGSLAVLGAIMLWRGAPTADLAPLLKVIDIQDMFAQADSFDKQLSFDGDIVTTAHFIKAAIAIGEYSGSFPLTSEQVVGFGNFAARGIKPSSTSDLFYTISLVSDLQSNKFAQPMHVKLISKKPFHSKNPIVVGIFSLDGSPKKNAVVTARSITRVADNEVVLSNGEFSLYAPKKDDAKEKSFSTETFFDAVYEYNGFMETNPEAGYYDVEIEVTGEKYFSFSDDAIRFRVKVTSEGAIKNVRMGLAAKGAPEYAWHPEALAEEQSIGRNGRVKVEFSVANTKTDANMVVHQAFVRCLNHINHVSVTFIAEQQKNGKYLASFDISDHFEHGGKHSINIIVGDAILHPGQLEHHIGVLEVNGVAEPEAGVFATKYLDRYRPLTPIHHTFKEPEPRPPVMISVIFTAACAIPLCGLLIAWAKMGVNVNRMESSFLPFHIAIGSVFGLYFMYWFKFNMFTTMKWLAVLGSATFILGNRVLSTLANKEK